MMLHHDACFKFKMYCLIHEKKPYRNCKCLCIKYRDPAPHHLNFLAFEFMDLSRNGILINN